MLSDGCSVDSQPAVHPQFTYNLITILTQLLIYSLLAATGNDTKKKCCKLHKETYSSYIYKGMCGRVNPELKLTSMETVLKQVHPDTSISNKVSKYINRPTVIQSLQEELPIHSQEASPLASTLLTCFVFEMHPLLLG